MANTVNCTLIGAWYTTSEGVPTYDGIANIQAGNRFSAEYCSAFIKFVIPTFSGITKSVTFDFSVVPFDDTTLNYAVCTSDANYAKYQKTSGRVVDENQITSGVWEFQKSDTSVRAQITVPVDGLKGNTTLYLILWANETGQSELVDFYMKDTNSPVIAVSYVSGIANIGGVEYQCYIGNGAEAAVYIPHVANGTGWDMCS